MACLDELLEKAKKEAIERAFPSLAYPVRQKVLNYVLKNDGSTAHKISRGIEHPTPSVLKACKILVEKQYLVTEEVPASRGPVEKARIYKIGPMGKLVDIVEKIPNANLCLWFSPIKKHYGLYFNEDLLKKWCEDPCLKELYLLVFLKKFPPLEESKLLEAFGNDLFFGLHVLGSFDLLVEILLKLFIENLLLHENFERKDADHEDLNMRYEPRAYVAMVHKSLVDNYLEKLGYFMESNIKEAKKVIIKKNSEYKKIIDETVKATIEKKKAEYSSLILGLLQIEDYMEKRFVDTEFLDEKKQSLFNILWKN